LAAARAEAFWLAVAEGTEDAVAVIFADTAGQAGQAGYDQAREQAPGKTHRDHCLLPRAQLGVTSTSTQ
jgi:hypothetical protein